MGIQSDDPKNHQVEKAHGLSVESILFCLGIPVAKFSARFSGGWSCEKHGGFHSSPKLKHVKKPWSSQDSSKSGTSWEIHSDFYINEKIKKVGWLSATTDSKALLVAWLFGMTGATNRPGWLGNQDQMGRLMAKTMRVKGYPFRQSHGWGFPKMRVPQNGGFVREILEMDDEQG